MIKRIQRLLKLIVGLLAAVAIIFLILKDSSAQKGETGGNKLSGIPGKRSALMITVILETFTSHRTRTK